MGLPLNSSLLDCLTPCVEQVKKQLFGLDKRGMGVEVAMKNELRRTIMVGFVCACIAFLGRGDARKSFFSNMSNVPDVRTTSSSRS